MTWLRHAASDDRVLSDQRSDVWRAGFLTVRQAGVSAVSGGLAVVAFVEQAEGEPVPAVEVGLRAEFTQHGQRDGGAATATVLRLGCGNVGSRPVLTVGVQLAAAGKV